MSAVSPGTVRLSACDIVLSPSPLPPWPPSDVGPSLKKWLMKKAVQAVRPCDMHHIIACTLAKFASALTYTIPL